MAEAIPRLLIPFNAETRRIVACVIVACVGFIGFIVCTLLFVFSYPALSMEEQMIFLLSTSFACTMIGALFFLCYFLLNFYIRACQGGGGENCEKRR